METTGGQGVREPLPSEEMDHTLWRRSADGPTVIRTMQYALHGLFVVLLTVGAVRAAQDADHPAAPVICAVLVLGWYAVGVRASRSRDVRIGTAWLLVLIAAWVGLILMSTEFSWVAFALFFLALHIVPRPVSLVLVAVITAVVVGAQIAADSSNAAAGIIGPCLGALVAVGISWIYAGMRAEASARQRLVDELVASHDAEAQAQREAGVLAERSRLARDIHDTLAQSFSSIVLLARAGLAGTPDADRMRELMRQIDETAGSGLRDARTVVRALAPDELEDAPLPGALRRLTDRLGHQSDTTASLVIEGDPRPLAMSVEVALLRLAQGALANVRQHAEATSVTVTLTYHDDAVQLDVVDDGVGFDPATTLTRSGGGFGLRAMRERLADLGGTLSVESEAGSGSAVSAGLPLESPLVEERQP